MRIDVKDLLAAVPALQMPGIRIGLPDEPTLIKIARPDRLAKNLDAAICAFQQLHPGTQTLVSSDLNTYRNTVEIRIVLNDRKVRNQDGTIEEPLAASFCILRATVEKDRGVFHYWGGNNYFDVSFPYSNPERDDFLDVDDLPWDARYFVRLERESWNSLRDTVFRFSNHATALTEHCVACGKTTVLIPSVGICVHPWLFANRGLFVIATDSSETALTALSKPERYPNLYSNAAYDRWDISNCASCAMMPHYEHFDGMPALEEEQVRGLLRQRIEFKVADWACPPVSDGTIDLVFATNAVPRGPWAEREAVLKEWVRVLRPGGFVFIAQHHAGLDWGVESFLRDHGLVERNFLNGEQLPDNSRGGFQTYLSSG